MTDDRSTDFLQYVNLLLIRQYTFDQSRETFGPVDTQEAVISLAFPVTISCALIPTVGMPSVGGTVRSPVISRRRNRIICRANVVGMTSPSSRDRLLRWKRRWWAWSHSWQVVALFSTDTPPKAVVGKFAGVVKSREEMSGVEDILLESHLQYKGRV